MKDEEPNMCAYCRNLVSTQWAVPHQLCASDRFCARGSRRTCSCCFRFLYNRASASCKSNTRCFPKGTQFFFLCFLFPFWKNFCLHLVIQKAKPTLLFWNVSQWVFQKLLPIISTILCSNWGNHFQCVARNDEQKKCLESHDSWDRQSGKRQLNHPC